MTITGTHFTHARAVRFGSTPATSFVVDSPTEITATAPAGSGRVRVTVTTWAGTSCSPGYYVYVPSPAVTGVSAPAGPAAGGKSVTITGTYFASATAVDFGSTPATSFTVDSDTQITAVAPAGTGAVDITVTSLGGTSATSPSDAYTYEEPPTAQILSPESGQTYNLNQTVPTAFTCADDPNGPGIQACTDSGGATNGTGTLDTATPGAHTYTVTATSQDGQTNTATIDYTVAPASPPTVIGGAPTNMTSDGAALSGAVDPEGTPTEAFFQYGLDPSERGPGAPRTLYDESTAPQPVGSDSSDHAVSVPLSGLLPGALYHARLVAVNSAGTTYGADQTFTTPAAPAPPQPVLGQSENAQPVTGTVFIKSSSGAYVPLTGVTQIRTGTQIDALHGSLQLTASVGKRNKEHGIFGGAVFKLTQARSGGQKGFTTLTIVERAFKGAPSYSLCAAHKADDATIAKASSRTLQLLRASAHGKFTTKGKYSAATVLGTKWTTADRCDGTLIHDITDSVKVTDFVRHKTVILHAGQSYLALAPGHRK